LIESAINYPFSVAFVVLSIWSAQMRLRNKKISKSFVITFITTSIAFYATPPNHNMGAIAKHVSKIIAADQSLGKVATTKFSPKQGATDYIIELIGKAEKSICIAAYSFTSETIANALAAANNKGIDVRIVLDKSQRTAKHSAYHKLKALKISIRINSHYAIMHNKFMIIDNYTLQTGSFNYTKAAELNNAENVIILRDNSIAKEYMQQWQRLWNEAS
jgi:phosphatidylserine/phosphatidylglycerophosphate/cardiolipin synthase-like enzyme